MDTAVLSIFQEENGLGHEICTTSRRFEKQGFGPFGLTSDPLFRPAADLYCQDAGKFVKSILK